MAKVTAKTTWKKNDLPALFKKLNASGKSPSVTIGFQGSEADEKKTSKNNGIQSTSLSAPSLVAVATFHEFGTVHVPQRSFIRSNDANNKETYKKVISEIRSKILFGTFTVAQGLGLLGEKIRLDIQAGIRKGLKPELKQKTIDAKGSDKPLIDTGQLINGITYKVRGEP